MRILIFCSLFLLALPTAQAQTTSDALLEEFFTKYALDTDTGFDYLFGTNRWMGADNEGVNNVKSRIKNLLGLVGNYIGYEVISEKALGESLKKVVVVVKYERQPLRFNFELYKPDKTWIIFNFSFNEELFEMLEDGGQ